MTKKKIKVGVLFGGKSAEHEVSLKSAKNIVEAIDKDKYEVVLVGIGKDGRWLLQRDSQKLLGDKNPKLFKLNEAGEGVTMTAGGGNSRQLISLASGEAVGQIDVVFPVLHGPFGEDGTVQGLLKLAGVPFVGAGVLGSAVGMDKDVTKRLLREAGIPVARFIALRSGDAENIDYISIKNNLGNPFFVKPANLGSSVGVHKVKSADQFNEALADAFSYDSKILLEEFVDGRELECSVLGNDNPIASFPGEVITNHEFYSYEAKYIDENGAALEIPAKVNRDIVSKVQSLAVKSFKTLCCEGMARVDFFLKPDGNLILNEINTIPGFTKISMYPKLWEASGVSYRELIDRLIVLAMERFERENKLKTTHEA